MDEEDTNERSEYTPRQYIERFKNHPPPIVALPCYIGYEGAVSPCGMQHSVRRTISRIRVVAIGSDVSISLEMLLGAENSLKFKFFYLTR